MFNSFTLFFLICHFLICRLRIARKCCVFSDIHFIFAPCDDSARQKRRCNSAKQPIPECPFSPRVVRKYSSFFIQKNIEPSIFFNCVICVTRFAESPEGDSEPSSWRAHGQSEELLLNMESSTSTDSSLVEGKQNDLDSWYLLLPLPQHSHCKHQPD